MENVIFRVNLTLGASTIRKYVLFILAMLVISTQAFAQAQSSATPSSQVKATHEGKKDAHQRETWEAEKKSWQEKKKAHQEQKALRQAQKSQKQTLSQ